MPWAHATELAELPVIAAAHILAPQILYGVLRAFESPDVKAEELVARWKGLSHADKARYIDTAVAILEIHRTRSPMQVTTGLRPTHGVVIGKFGPA